MAFPTSLDDLSTTRATAGTDRLSAPDHLTHHEAEDAAIEALEAKVGIDNSAVVTSLDYLIKNAASVEPGHKHSKLWASDGNPQAIFVDAAGDVGIGRLPAAGKFEVYAASPNIYFTNEGGSQIRFIAGDAIAYIQTQTEHPLVFTTNNAAAALAIDISQNVGMGGVTSPAAKLHIDQSASGGAIPVLILDQADISEGFINFIGSDRGVIAAATPSLKSVRVELAGTVYRLALYVDA